MNDNRSLIRKKEAMASLSLFLLIVSLIINGATGAASENTLSGVLPAYAVASKAETTLNSSLCSQELSTFRDAVNIRKLWAIRMLDSSGVPKPGFIYGNKFWLGSRFQCNDLTNKNPFLISPDILRNATKYRKPEEEFPPFEPNYFVVRFRHNSTIQYQSKLPDENQITLGLCLPASCTTDQLRLLVEKMFQERTLLFNELYIVDFQLEVVKDLQTDGRRLINTRAIIGALVLAVTLLLMVAGTIYDVRGYQKNLKVENAKAQNHDNNASNGLKLTMEIADSGLYAVSKGPNLFGKILKCFSVYNNTKFIFTTKMGTDAIDSINGLRFLTMFLLISIHAAYFNVDLIDNKAMFLRISDGLAMQAFVTGAVTVNTFFVISGFLVVYHYFKQNLKNTTENDVSCKSKLKEFFFGILKRFIRLTPAYMMALGIAEFVSTLYDDISIFYTYEEPQNSCAKYWWRNLFYIQNLFRLEDLCASWSWYLANDMQYYIIGTFIVLLSSIHFYTAVTILAAIFFGSIFASGYISYINGFTPTLDEMYHVAHLMYYSPWIRIGAYIVGMVAGYILAQLNNKLEMKRRNIIGLWVVGSASSLFVLFGLYERRISVTATAFYSALSNTAWSFLIGWILIACCTNHGGFVNKILSWKVWVPLGRLTYCAYLLNPIIIRAAFMYAESPVHFEILPLLIIAAGCITSTYIGSYIFSLMMEIPYLHIVKLFTKPRRRDQ